MNDPLGLKIKELRELRNLTQTELATKAGLTNPSLISRLESGKTVRPTNDTLVKILRALGGMYLLGDKDLGEGPSVTAPALRVGATPILCAAPAFLLATDGANRIETAGWLGQNSEPLWSPSIDGKPAGTPFEGRLLRQKLMARELDLILEPRQESPGEQVGVVRLASLLCWDQGPDYLVLTESDKEGSDIHDVPAIYAAKSGVEHLIGRLGELEKMRTRPVPVTHGGLLGGRSLQAVKEKGRAVCLLFEPWTSRLIQEARKAGGIHTRQVIGPQQSRLDRRVWMLDVCAYIAPGETVPASHELILSSLDRCIESLNAAEYLEEDISGEAAPFLDSVARGLGLTRSEALDLLQQCAPKYELGLSSVWLRHFRGGR